MNLRENVMAVLNGKQPDYYGDLMNAVEFIFDPVFMQDAMIPQDGSEHVDSWGTVRIFLPGAPGPHPHLTKENIVIKDIEKWEEQLVIPSIQDLDWSAAREQSLSINREEKLACIFSPGGLFERSHFLMGMENALMNYLEYPEEMKALLRKIADYKIEFIRKAGEECHPDIIFYHDDWGTKQNLFLPPQVWREIIKPLQKEISDAIHEAGMIYMHHADCICQPIVEDMVEIGIDIWQGTIAQNDIVEIQRITKGNLPMVGGIDGPKIDIENITEEEIRAEVRRAIDTYCPGGPFFPSIPNGICFREWNNSIVMDELESYGREYAQKHPVNC
ncbi:uroporphyrinogen decarboxylase family protein [Alkalibacter mobilis]|uniref:uroporphyrinogen decarboxylase family protein n=1 Tax=Alkalibacter mobilis TaxID=2787712 RepID=UPI00189CC24E|nr:uroporphyrinogen decarboxylase family protein [Alkalibacter mobilis]MBF7095631.1 methyltransferase [Alkalibacter mobilis]